jgi:hypothetical protein
MRTWDMETVNAEDEILEMVATRVANTLTVQQVLGKYFVVGVGPDNESLVIPIPDYSPAEDACNVLFELLSPERLPQLLERPVEGEGVADGEDGDG